MDEFLTYAKEVFDLDVSFVEAEVPDSYETLFGTSISDGETNVFIMENQE